MARREARLKTRIWDDQDFLDLPGPEQLAYLFLLSQPDISHNGVLPLRLKRWAKKLKYTTGQLEKILFGLEQARFVVVDDEEEELLVRSFLRNDEVYKQPKVLLAASRQLNEIASVKLQGELAREIERVLSEGLAGDNTRPTLLKMLGILGRVADTRTDTQVNTLSDTQSDTPPEGHGEGIPEGFPIPDAMPTGVGVGVGGNLKVRTTQGSTSSRPDTASGGVEDHDTGNSEKPKRKIPKADQVPRLDVDAICQALVDHRVRLDCKKPTITQEWRTEARRMFDIDKRPLQEALDLLAWSQNDDFWKSNIESIPTFRTQYDKLRLRRGEKGRAPASPRVGNHAVSDRSSVKKWKKHQ